MTTLISLGCNCHPAWWLRKLKLRTQSLPFDWLLSKPHVGLDYALQVHANGFAGWLDDLAVNPRGHPVAARYPAVELFHHHDLVDADPERRVAEKTRLVQRARAFEAAAGEHGVQFLYCYPMHDRLPRAEDLAQFDAAVDRALAAWPHATLHVYFMADVEGLLSAPLLAPRPRLVEHAYFRDQSVDKNWGTEPPFLRAIAGVLPAPAAQPER